MSADLIDPDMPAQQLRMHMGEMTSQEMRTARAAIRWVNTRLRAAREAEASDGERRGLERALVAIGYCGAARGPGEPWHDQHDSAVAKCYDAIRALIPEAPARENWLPIETAPEDERVILATTGGHIGEAIMLVDEDTGTQKWTWALGPVHPNHVPVGWMAFPSPPQDHREG